MIQDATESIAGKCFLPWSYNRLTTMYLLFCFNIIDDDGEYYAILFSTKAQHASKKYFKLGKKWFTFIVLYV